MKLLANLDKVDVYVISKENWLDPILVLKEMGKQKAFTVSSGDLELPLGEFIVNYNLVQGVDEVIEELSEKGSLIKLSDKRSKFKLKEVYLEKLKKIYHS